MLRSELVTRLKREDRAPAEIEQMLDAMLGEICAALERGDRVEIRGFGAFSVRVREARTGRNPRTNEPVLVPAKRTPFFRPGKELKARLNRAP